jgi:hypothetical protein
MSSSTRLHQNLDTTFVNLWSLLRNLTQQGFIGRVRVDLRDYTADIFLNGSSIPLVREIDRATNVETIEEGVLHRVVLRVRETPGVINVFEGADEATPPPAITAPRPQTTVEASAFPAPVAYQQAPPVKAHKEPEPRPIVSEPVSPIEIREDVYRSGSYQDWPAILAATGELIAAVERGINSMGGNFTALFDAARLGLADDYVFLDPIAQTLRYANGVASLKTELPVSIFVDGTSEALRRTVNLVATGERARRVRERVALEMLPVARRRVDVLEKCGLRMQLDRIAGTTVM